MRHGHHRLARRRARDGGLQQHHHGRQRRQGDVNYDGKTDVADIAEILSMMAGAAKK